MDVGSGGWWYFNKPPHSSCFFVNFTDKYSNELNVDNSFNSPMFFNYAFACRVYMYACSYGLVN